MRGSRFAKGGWLPFQTMGALTFSKPREAGRWALRLFEPNLANVRADLRSLYVADVDHGFRLDLIDLDEHIGGLKRALAKERELNKEIKANGGTSDGLAAMSAFRVMPALTKTKPAPDVRAGLLPRRGTPQRGIKC
jgi:hypothetical protein